MSSKTTELVELLSPLVEALGLELVGIEYAPSRSRSMLRIYIDVADRHVGIEDCESVSREVSALLDVEDPISAEYTLEVSSPGIDRPLFTAAQFERFVGETAKVSLRIPQEGRRRLQGVIAKVENGMITITEEEGEFVVAHENIEKARLVPDLVALGLAKTKPGKSPRPGKAAKPAGESE